MATAERRSANRPRWLRLLHRVGYVTTALVVVELLGISFLATRAWLQDREMRASLVEDSRTHDGPVRADDDIIRRSAAYLFSQLPTLSALHGDGLRFVAMPSFNQAHFAVAIYMPSPQAKDAEGVLLRFDQQNNYAPLGQRLFRMPAAAFRSLAVRMDKLTDGWPGSSDECLDGTPAAFERVRGRRVTSGVGGCGQHYEDVARLNWNYLKRFAPGPDLPTRGDWEPEPKR
jgi:hypothetical protein